MDCIKAIGLLMIMILRDMKNTSGAKAMRDNLSDVVEKYTVKHGLYKGDWIIDDYDFTGYEEYIGGESYVG